MTPSTAAFKILRLSRGVVAISQSPPPCVGTISTRTFNERRSQRGKSIDRELHANQGHPAYLGLTLENEERTISWEYRTKHNKYVNPNYFDWNLFDGDRVKAHGACVRDYDSRQLARYDAYSREYLVTLARRRVLRFSETGIRNEDLPTKVKSVIFTGTYLDEIATVPAVVARDGTRTKKKIAH
ncbi:hypothetical protein LRP88_13383 [Fusarium phalaenopsidis]|nr:hypothetical protein NCS56_00296200 [Fusarium sp. Ph1]